MGFHRHVRDRRFTWLFALVFTVFLFPTVLWAADEQDSILGKWNIKANTRVGTVSSNLITFSPGGGLILVVSDGTTKQGTWTHSGGNKFEFLFDTFTERDGVAYTTRLTETISITGDTYEGKYKSRTFRPDGKRVGNVGNGSTSGVRVLE